MGFARGRNLSSDPIYEEQQCSPSTTIGPTLTDPRPTDDARPAATGFHASRDAADPIAITYGDLARLEEVTFAARRAPVFF